MARKSTSPVFLSATAILKAIAGPRAGDAAPLAQNAGGPSAEPKPRREHFEPLPLLLLMRDLMPQDGGAPGFDMSTHAWGGCVVRPALPETRMAPARPRAREGGAVEPAHRLAMRRASACESHPSGSQDAVRATCPPPQNRPPRPGKRRPRTAPPSLLPADRKEERQRREGRSEEDTRSSTGPLEVGEPCKRRRGRDETTGHERPREGGRRTGAVAKRTLVPSAGE